MMNGSGVSRWTMVHFGCAIAALLMAEVLLVVGYADPLTRLRAPATLIVVHLVTIGWLAPVIDTVDVRNLIPRERHRLIFKAFSNLPAGDAFLLVNDHDPKPLYYQLQAQLGQPFLWEHLESSSENYLKR